MMEVAAAAVSLHHHHGALPLPATLPPPHRSSLPIPVVLPQTTTTKRPCVCSSSSKPPPAACQLTTQTELSARSAHAAHPDATHLSSRAATGYAAALADACVRAGTLRRPSINARALLLSRSSSRVGKEEAVDARVAALVRMLVRKGKADMVAEVMAEFAAICDKLLPRPALQRAQYQYHGCY